MIFMPNYSKNDVILVGYPFSDLSFTKVRPGIVISVPHPSQEIWGAMSLS
jgi:mRNA interferase MazF